MTGLEPSTTALDWTEDGAQRSAHWHSENQSAAPTQVTVISDDITADAAYRLARSGAGLLWRGDYHNGRQLLQAMDRRVKRHSARRGAGKHGGGGGSGAGAFETQRRFIADRARLLGTLIVELDDGYQLNLRRAPDVRLACEAAYGPSTGPMCVSLTELNGVLSAYQWQLKGVAIPALGEDVHPPLRCVLPDPRRIRRSGRSDTISRVRDRQFICTRDGLRSWHGHRRARRSAVAPRGRTRRGHGHQSRVR